MVQGLKLPTPLSLNASMSHQNAAGGALPAASVPPLLPAATLGASVPAAGAGGSNAWASVNGNGVLMPVLGSSNNLTASNGASPTAAAVAAKATTRCIPGSADSQPTSAAVSSCDTVTAAGSNGLPPNSLSVGPCGFAPAGHCLLQQQHSGNSGNNCLLSQLRSVVFRASSYAPEVQGLSGLYPGPSSPTAMQNLVHQLEQLPHTARVQLQQVSAIMEDTLSKAKAADAAVVAVTQVLAAKKQAAADARQKVENSILQFKQMLGQISPSVAAAAAGAGSSSAYCSPVPTPVATGPGRCCIATMSSGCLAAAAAAAVGMGAPVCCGSDDCMIGSSRLGGNSPRVLVTQGLTSHPTQGFDLSTDGFGSSAAAADGNLGHDGLCGDHSDADDLIRDPEEGAATAAGGAAVEPAAVNNKQQHQQQECSAAGGCCGDRPAMAAPTVLIKAEQQDAASPTAAAAEAVKAEQLQPAWPGSTSGSSDSPLAAAAEHQLQQQNHLSVVSSPEPQQHDDAMVIDDLLSNALNPAAEAATVAA